LVGKALCHLRLLSFRLSPGRDVDHSAALSDMLFPARRGRGRRLLVALAFLQLPIPAAHRPPAFAALHAWLDSWPGIGAIERGMAHQGFDLALTRDANEGWRATLFNAGREHSTTSSTGSAWEPTAWEAVQGRRGKC
jgi:hypothetical protein